MPPSPPLARCRDETPLTRPPGVAVLAARRIPLPRPRVAVPHPPDRDSSPGLTSYPALALRVRGPIARRPLPVRALAGRSAAPIPAGPSIAATRPTTDP